MSIAFATPAAAAATSYVITLAESGGAFLYLRGSVGSLNPISTFKGNNINRLQASVTVPFRLDIAPAGLSQSFFDRLVVQKTSGAWVVLPSSTPTFTSDTGLGTTAWEWGLVYTDQVWTATGNRGVLIF